MISIKNITLVILAILATTSILSASPIECVTSISIFEQIATEIGGDKVRVSNLGPHDQDMHHVMVRPSHLATLQKAELLIHAGLDAEPWLGGLVESSGNRNILPGNAGELNCSAGISVLGKPERVSRELGDVHPGGNPHYWLDPLNIIHVGRNIKNRFGEIRPEHKDYFETNYNQLVSRWRENILDWETRLSSVRPVKIIDYHNSWTYFYRRFKLTHVTTIEPKPGIKPSGAHLAKVIAEGKAQNIDLIIAEPFFPRRDVQMVANQIGVPTLIIQQTPGGEYDSMESIFEAIISFIEKVKQEQ